MQGIPRTPVGSNGTTKMTNTEVARNFNIRNAVRIDVESVIKNKKPCQSRVQNKQGKDNMDPDPHSGKKYNIYCPRTTMRSCKPKRKPIFYSKPFFLFLVKLIYDTIILVL